MLDFDGLYEFVLKTWDENEAREIVASIENALDRQEFTKRLGTPLLDRFKDAKKRLDRMAA